MVLGIINGGRGFQLTGVGFSNLAIAYTVLAAVFGVAYLATIAFGVAKQRRNSGFRSKTSAETGTHGSSHS